MGYGKIERIMKKKERKIERNPRPPSTHPLPIARAMGPRVLYPLDLCPILNNLSMQHISGYNLIQGAIGCSVASPLSVAKSGMKRDYMRNTMSQRNARVALSALPHPRMLYKEGYGIQIQRERDKKRKGQHKHAMWWLERHEREGGVERKLCTQLGQFSIMETGTSTEKSYAHSWGNFHP